VQGERPRHQKGEVAEKVALSNACPEPFIRRARKKTVGGRSKIAKKRKKRGKNESTSSEGLLRAIEGPKIGKWKNGLSHKKNEGDTLKRGGTDDVPKTVRRRGETL